LSTPVEPVRLLLVAQDPAWAALLRQCLAPLGSAAVLVVAASFETVDEIFHADRAAVVLATPQSQPAPGRCALPVVLLLDHEPEQAPMGASDWLVKGSLNADTLRRCLRHVRERGVLENTLQRLAEQDPLTGIANRQGFQTLLNARLAEFDGRGLALGHLDLDNFRHANDALGHQAGDRALARVAATLQQGLRASDTLGRYGGEEFMALVTGADAELALSLAEQLCQRLAQQADDDQAPACTVSIGVAVVGAGDPQSDSVLARADAALYQAKAAGRNRVVLA